MSVFTDEELEYMQNQRLGRLATVRPDGKPQVAPVGYRYNAELDVIDIGGRAMSQSKKFRNLADNPHVALVIDDVLPPWHPRGVEIRGTAEALPSGASAMFGSASYVATNDALIRITPTPIISWGLVEEMGWERNRRKVERK